MQDVFAALERWGLLLVQDKRVPSVVGIVTGETLSTSWWSHPHAQQVFDMLEILADHPDVLMAKLLDGKNTLVHRRLWPDMLAVGLAREPWQLENLSDEADNALRLLDSAGDVSSVSGPAIKLLAVRLLAHTQQVHSASGRHVLVAEAWPSWSMRVGCIPAPSVLDAKATLEQTSRALGAASASLPWAAGNRAVRRARPIR